MPRQLKVQFPFLGIVNCFMLIPSCVSSHIFFSIPPEYPVKLPPAPTTLWQGMIIETGLSPTAPPTAWADMVFFIHFICHFLCNISYPGKAFFIPTSISRNASGQAIIRIAIYCAVQLPNIWVRPSTCVCTGLPNDWTILPASVFTAFTVICWPKTALTDVSKGSNNRAYVFPTHKGQDKYHSWMKGYCKRFPARRIDRTYFLFCRGPAAKPALMFRRL